MAQLAWDASGERVYQQGVSKGVLYLQDGRAVVWNGLTGMDEGSESEITSYYLDGAKYLQNLTPGEFSGKLKALTYPNEFDEVLGIVEPIPGLQYYEQPPMSFGMSYQTKIGNDQNSDAGYKIHLLYNLLAVPDDASFETIGDSSDAVEFSWSLTGTPSRITGYRPTVHVVVDSAKTPAEVLEVIENVLYGTDESNPRLLPISELRSLFELVGSLTIIDNGDGTWTAIDPINEYITMDSSTQFTIAGADATMLDATTYTITTTTP